VHTPRIIVDSLGECALSIPSGVGATLVLSGANYHHIVRVFRLDRGSSFEILSLAERVVLNAEILAITKESAMAVVTAVREPTVLRPSTVIMGECRSGVLDEIVEHLTEIGTSHLAIFRGEKSGPWSSKREGRDRSQRLNKIVMSALKQSGFGYPPQISYHLSLRNCLESLAIKNESEISDSTAPCTNSPLGKYLLCAPHNNCEEEVPNLFDVLWSERKQKHIQDISKLADTYVIVGPEAGTSEDETSVAKEFGFTMVSLGPKTLRAQTAATIAAFLAVALQVRV